MGKATSLRFFCLICLLLIAVTLAVYWQVCGFDFVNLDDELYVTDNSGIKGLTWHNVVWAFDTNRASNWHPLTWVSLMLDYEAGELDPGVYHRTNLILHVLDVLLLFAVLSAMTGRLWRSAFVAALFAVHPLHVESVAWITERKDVLSTFFWFLAMYAYWVYVRRPAATTYALVMLLFALGLLAKPMLVTLPLTLLLLDYWPLGRFEKLRGEVGPRPAIWRLVREKIPLFVLSAAFSVVTFCVQKRVTVPTTFVIPDLGARVANAIVSCASYLEKMVWPKSLSVFYQHPGNTLPVWQVIVSGALLVGLTVLAIRAARNRRYVTVGWLWYLITLFPVIGIVQVGEQAMADRYSYVPLIGVFVAIAWAAPEMLGPSSALRRVALAVAAAVVICTMTLLGQSQAAYWRNGVTLWRHGVATTPHNARAHEYLADALYAQGLNEEAIEHYLQALRINPHYYDPHAGVATVYADMGNIPEAIRHLRAALKICPKAVDAHTNLGVFLATTGRMDEAIKHFKIALKLDPGHQSARMNLRKARAIKARKR